MSGADMEILGHFYADTAAHFLFLWHAAFFLINFLHSLTFRFNLTLRPNCFNFPNPSVNLFCQLVFHIFDLIKCNDHFQTRASPFFVSLCHSSLASVGKFRRTAPRLQSLFTYKIFTKMNQIFGRKQFY